MSTFRWRCALKDSTAHAYHKAVVKYLAIVLELDLPVCRRPPPHYHTPTLHRMHTIFTGDAPPPQVGKSTDMADKLELLCAARGEGNA